MSIAEDLARVREGLESNQLWAVAANLGLQDATAALDALARLEESLVPDLPDGWAYEELSELNGTWAACLVAWDGRYRSIPRHGPTVRAAVESALEALAQEASEGAAVPLRRGWTAPRGNVDDAEGFRIGADGSTPNAQGAPVRPWAPAFCTSSAHVEEARIATSIAQEDWTMASRLMLQVGVEGHPFNAHRETGLCQSSGCIPAATPLPDATRALVTAAQAVVERWHAVGQRLGATYACELIPDLEALQQALEAVQRETP